MKDDQPNDLAAYRQLKKQQQIDAENERLANIERARQAEYDADTEMMKFENPELDALRVKLVQVNADLALSATDEATRQHYLKMRARYGGTLTTVPGDPDSDTESTH